MTHVEKLVADGVVEVRDGKVYLTRQAWNDAVKGTPYEERGLYHFVGFKDDRYLTAVKTFGKPDFVHRFWDRRARDEVAPGDVVFFAEGDETQPVREFAYDDSANF